MSRSVKILSIAVIMLVWLIGCNTNEEVPAFSSYSDIIIPVSKSPLFGDLSKYNLNNTDTRALNADVEQVSLESLLDRNRSSSLDVDNRHIVQIPFTSNQAKHNALIKDSTHEEMYSINIFLIESTRCNEQKHAFVVSMLSSQDFDIKHSSTPSWLERANFTGIILYHSLEGKLLETKIYNNGLAVDTEMINRSNNALSKKTVFLYILKNMDTRSDDCEEDGWEDEIEASYCIAEQSREEFHNESHEESHIYRQNTEHSDSGGCSSSSNNDGADSGDNDYTEEDILLCNVSLYNGNNCTVNGSGNYTRGSFVMCNCVSGQGFVFDRWVGDFAGQDNEVCIFCISKDYSSTAYVKPLMVVGRLRPCVDSVSGKGNPLFSVSIAASKPWNIGGGTFGNTRSNGTQYHSGLDIAAEPGTEVYSMYDGVISSSKYVTEQPTRNSDGSYSEDYIGDKDGSGNRIYIESEINGNTVIIGYWHLQSGTPVATNPRTGLPFAPGDYVYQGELVAYTGRTGNAYNVDEPHLHLVVKIGSYNSPYVNPEQFINGTVHPGERTITNIICN